jgi:hypothetical protein
MLADLQSELILIAVGSAASQVWGELMTSPFLSLNVISIEVGIDHCSFDEEIVAVTAEGVLGVVGELGEPVLMPSPPDPPPQLDISRLAMRRRALEDFVLVGRVWWR